jgi:glycosyltransferase involved in cell wall biosynthesis
LKVLLYLPDLEGGGAQRTMLNLATVLRDRDGVTPHLVLGARDGPAMTWCSNSVERTFLPPGRARAQVAALRATVRDLRPDVALSTMLHGNLVLYLATRLMPKRPMVVLRETNSHAHRDDLKPWQTALAGVAYRAADRVVALSNGVRDELVSRYGLSPSRCVTIHNPVDLSAPPAPATRRPRADGFHFLTIGRLSPQKNQALLLRAFAALRDPSARLTILGEGPLREDLENLAARLDIVDRVAFPGFREDTARYLASADGFVLSSRYEGFGHVLVEALGAGLPVISTDCPFGPADILSQDETGLLVPNEDLDALTAAMARLMADEELRERLASNGPARARDFEASRIGGAYVALFRDCMAE